MATETAASVEAAKYIVTGCPFLTMLDMQAADAAMEAALHAAMNKAAAGVEAAVTITENIAVATGRTANASVAPLRLWQRPAAKR